MSNKDYKKEIAITILDKGILALLLAIGGYLLNGELQRQDLLSKERMAHLTINNDTMIAHLSRNNEKEIASFTLSNETNLAHYKANQEIILQQLKDSHEEQVKQLDKIANVQLENIRANNSFRNTIEEIRARKLGEVWETVYALDTYCQNKVHQLCFMRFPITFDYPQTQCDTFEYLMDIHMKLRRGVRQQIYENSCGRFKLNLDSLFHADSTYLLSETERLSIYYHLKAGVDSAVAIASQNRFWLGDEGYQQIEDFIFLIQSLNYDIIGDKFENVFGYFVKMDNNRVSINNVRDRIIN